MEDIPVHRIQPKTLKKARRLRLDQTPMEKRLWRELRGRRLAGLKFRRQYPVGPYIVDFFCAEEKLVVEIDGDSHADNPKLEGSRTKWLENRGFHIIRFTNQEVDKLLKSVLEVIKTECGVV